MPAPFRPNLLSSVSPEPRPTDGRWTGGIAYTPVKYLGGGTVDPCDNADEKTPTDSGDEVQWNPYFIYDDVQCSTLGDLEDVQRRLREAFTLKQSHLIEEVLWTNTVDGGDYGATYPNVSLSDATLTWVNTTPTQAQIDAGSVYVPNGTVSAPVVTAFRDLIEAMDNQLNGARGMIHVESRILPDIQYAGLAVQNGQRLTTSLGDHIIVPGTGYTGSSPDEDDPGAFHSWVYGTSMVEVLTSDISVVGVGEEIINRTNNQVTARLEQLALAHWDRQCHVAVSVCLEDPYGDCSDSGS